jgi:hypothetical protein
MFKLRREAAPYRHMPRRPPARPEGHHHTVARIRGEKTEPMAASQDVRETLPPARHLKAASGDTWRAGAAARGRRPARLRSPGALLAGVGESVVAVHLDQRLVLCKIVQFCVAKLISWVSRSVTVHGNEEALALPVAGLTVRPRKCHETHSASLAI